MYGSSLVHVFQEKRFPEDQCRWENMSSGRKQSQPKNIGKKRKETNDEFFLEKAIDGVGRDRHVKVCRLSLVTEALNRKETSSSRWLYDGVGGKLLA